MPPEQSLLTPATGNQLLALRAHIDGPPWHGPKGFAAAHAVNQRTIERIYAGTRSVPRWLLAQMEAANG